MDLAAGMSFSGTGNPKNFEVGEKWGFEIRKRSPEAGEKVIIEAHARDLAVGSKWSITGYNDAEWRVGDEIVINASHNYENDIQTLTDTIRYEANGEVLMGDVKLNGTGDFKTGDLIKIKTRGYVGDVESDGLYTFGQSPTTYELTVTKGGAITDAEIQWKRQDGRTDTEKDGQGTLSGADLVADEFIYIEEGVSVKIADVLSGGQSVAYLAQGDQITISAGEKLTYHFTGQLTLKSADNIQLKYNEDKVSEVDNKLGRLNFNGSIEQANNEGDKDLSLQQGTLGTALEHSLAKTHLLSAAAVRDAIRTIDISLYEITQDRVTVGAALNRIEHKSLALSRKTIDLLGIHMRLTGTDMAEEVA